MFTKIPFLNIRSRKKSSLSPQPPPSHPPPSQLQPPSPRLASFDSTLTATQDRSLTPRPTITLSISPPNELHSLSSSLDPDSATSDSSHDPSISPRKKLLSLSVWRELEHGLGTELDPDSAEESEDYSIPWKRQTLATMPYKSSEKPSSHRSRLKALTAPPSIPLPSPPTGSASYSSLPSVPTTPTTHSSPESSLVPPTKIARRPRAHTINSVLSPTTTTTTTLPLPPPPSRTPSVRSKGKSISKILQDTQGSLDDATPEQLRHALKTQRTRFDDLARYLLSVTEKHAAEKLTLMKKIDTLEREARKTNRELKGLRYLVMHGTGSGALNAVPSSSTNRDYKPINTTARTDPITKKPHRKPDNVSRSASLNVPAVNGKPDLPAADIPHLPSSDKRSSIASYSSSATSSTSSLHLPSLTSSSTLAALSAIPEAPTSIPRRVLDDRQREKEEKRAFRRLSSSSSSASSSSSPSIAYTSNLKRGRPPSIAQVLGESSSMEDVLEKLRPFAAPPIPSHPLGESPKDTVTIPTCL